MLYNLGNTNTVVIYCHSTVITKVMLLYNTEWQYDHGMEINYRSKKFYNIGPRLGVAIPSVDKNGKIRLRQFASQ